LKTFTDQTSENFRTLASVSFQPLVLKNVKGTMTSCHLMKGTMTSCHLMKGTMTSCHL